MHIGFPNILIEHSLKIGQLKCDVNFMLGMCDKKLQKTLFDHIGSQRSDHNTLLHN